MRRKIMIFFVCLVTIPIFIIYFMAVMIFSNHTEKNLLTLYSNDIKAIGKNADRFFADALDLSIYPLMENNLRDFLVTPINDRDFFTISRNADNIFSSMPYGFSEGIREITLLSENGSYINKGNVLSGINKQEIEKSIALNGKPLWQYESTETDDNSDKNRIYLTRLLKNPSNISSKIGFIKIAISRSQLFTAITSNQVNDTTTYFIIDSDNKSILSTDSDYNFESIQNYISYENLIQLARKHSTSIFYKKHFISAYEIRRTPFIIFSVTKPNILTMVTGTLSGGLTIISILVFVFSILLSSTFSKIITSPLEKLGKHMQSISNEDFKVRFTIKGNDEIAALAGNFNYMVEKLDFLYTEVYMGQLKLKQAQLNALQTQINPHFLYNTLDTIYWMSEMGDTKNVSLMVSNMSKMLRITLSSDQSEMITLEGELEHLNCYIDIQRIRYGDSIKFEIQCDDSLKKHMVLRLLLQPLVENALIHGMKDHAKGTIKLLIYRNGNELVYDLMNDGKPINIESIKSLLEKSDNDLKGFAIRNINERIKLKFGDNHCLNYFIKDGFSVFRIEQLIDA